MKINIFEIRKIIKKIIGNYSYNFLRLKYRFIKNFSLLVYNFYIDAYLFFKHSTVFYSSNFEKLETKIILFYHAIEKGFLHEGVNFRARFAKQKISVLIKLLKHKKILENNLDSSQVLIAYNVACKYYEKHLNLNIDISDYFSESEYLFFKNLIRKKVNITINHSDKSYFSEVNSNFAKFSKSRKSVRHFKKQKINESLIKKVVDLTKHAPSVCNRQPNKVIYVSDKNKIDKLLKIQGGLRGYEENIYNLIIVTSNRNFFYSVGERNQLYIDGGIFVMNLLYSLHYYKIAACPAHWGFNRDKDIEVQNELKLNESEKVICFIAIGLVKDKFKSCFSERRKPEEVLRIIN